jgi:hypothetical protein
MPRPSVYARPVFSFSLNITSSIKKIITLTFQQNIAKAKKDVERLDAEDAASSSPAAKPTAHVNGHGETKTTASIAEGGSVANEVDHVKGAVADVVADLKGTSLVDTA